MKKNYVHLKEKGEQYPVYFYYPLRKGGYKEVKIADVCQYHWAERLARMVAKEHNVDWRDIKDDIADRCRDD